MLTEDLPTRLYRTPSVSTPPYSRPAAPQLQHMSDEPKQTVFHCTTHARIPLRLELRPNLTKNDLDTLVRTFFGLNAGDVITYMKGDQSFQSVGYEECMGTSEFHIDVSPDLRYQQHPFASSQANARHPSAHISGYGGLTARAGLVYSSARSSSPSSGRGRRSGSANGTISNVGATSTGGRSRSMKRQPSGHSHPAVEELVDEYVHDHALYQQQSHHLASTTSHTSDGKGNKIEPVASAEISLDNIVEGSRRKRAKFSSAVSLEFACKRFSPFPDCINRNCPYSQSRYTLLHIALPDRQTPSKSQPH